MSVKKLVSFRLPEELIAALRVRAQGDGISMTELVFRLLKQGLSESGDAEAEPLEALVNQRVANKVATLEAEFHKLQDEKKQTDSLVSSPLYSLLMQSAFEQSQDFKNRERLDRLEKMVEQLIQAQSDSHPS
ncbi:hypothetical protein IQ260_28735 [Leptolyngbya cf. ectocarpi LEGE 11479]|uniref:Uncharacterized protein n=1 Tax=Leptolyngbya cf. ectocarpi LEGE 11479 TaxID=1828722 RepID=A0A929A084_LEPEC|nr:hypothetical protein [Leptolyngbya ectocarpi]MBE9070631.1 hypothetical protein [Leptolyngbya cf. ectocarpi LEGE 11479]